MLQSLGSQRVGAELKCIYFTFLEDYFYWIQIIGLTAFSSLL